MRPSASLITVSSSSPRRGTWRRRRSSIRPPGLEDAARSPAGSSSEERRAGPARPREPQPPPPRARGTRISTLSMGRDQPPAGGKPLIERAGGALRKKEHRAGGAFSTTPQAFRLALRLPRTTRKRGFNLEALRTRCSMSLRDGASNCNALVFKIPATSGRKHAGHRAGPPRTR
jgi:hypothetical protein